jgi:hypothetical protein
MAQPATLSTGIDAATVRELAGWRDAADILSVYVDASADRLVGNPPPVALTARIALDALVDGREGAVRRALEDRLRELEPTLERLYHPREHGTGRALFAGVDSGRTSAFAIQLPLPDLVALAPRPRLRPLLHGEAAGRPAGLLLVGRHGVRMVDWRCGEVQELQDLPLPDERDTWDDRPPRGGTFGNVRNASDGRNHRSRRSAWDADALAAAVPRVAAQAGERGWCDIVLAGDVQLVRELAEELPDGGPPIILDTRTLEWRGAAAAADELVPGLLRAREERARAALREAQDLAAAGSRGAVGERDVLEALALGRVEHLFVDCTAPGTDADLDELVGLAVETDAAVTALDPLTADGSQTVAAAILRW